MRRTFTRDDRLRLQRDFDRVLREGGSARGRLLSVRAAANALGWPRLGLAVPRAAGIAVARNRMKRLLREAFRLHRERLPAGCDLVVRPVSGDLKRWTLAAAAEELIALSAQALARARKPGTGVPEPGTRG